MKALALLSGGLDSILAAKVVQAAGVEVEAVNFIIPFLQERDSGKGSGVAAKAAAFLGVKLHYHECGAEYLRVVEKPRHGYGKRLNPCLDCRIYKFQAAAQKMREIGASFLVTGEVFDQRPNSQRRDAMDITARDAGLKGLVLRPLSAKLLQPTIPELEGWIDREKLLDIKGRGRTRQMELAAKFGLTDYPSPTGGCLLTCEEYSRKVADLIKFEGGLTLRAVELLRFGRHLRLSPSVKIIVGKNRVENEVLRKMAAPGDVILELADIQGPTTLYLGPEDGEALKLAAAITAGFSKAPVDVEAKVFAQKGGEISELWVKPLTREKSKGFYVYQV
ncbi:MAG: hypothetical protein K6U80_00310 [Firmicutes bacterium]|nr:hypothetical protein [Bacillota bacterium]